MQNILNPLLNVASELTKSKKKKEKPATFR